MLRKKINFKSSFSKAQFEIFKSKDKIFIKKKFNPPNYRDYESIIKNNDMRDMIAINNLKIQKINIKSYNHLLNTKSYKSLYINGSSGELIIKNSGVYEINLLKNFLFSYFTILKKFNHLKKINNMIFYNKLNDIEKKIKIPSLKLIFKKNKPIIENKIRRIDLYPTGICHGDLTLSNIIIEKKKIYLFDFLKTYNDNILQDISKIYQEFILGWSSRYLVGTDRLRSKIFSQMIIDQHFFNLFPKNLIKHLKFEVLMTLFRIFPYVDKNDEVTINWLNKSIEKVLKKRVNYINS